MSTTSTIEPGLGDNWSSFGAIIIVSVLGPVLTLLLTGAPLVLLPLAPALLDFALCGYVDSCADLGSGDWPTWAFEDYSLLYVCWAMMGAGSACVVTLEFAFHTFRRAAPLPVVAWHAALFFVFSLWFPVESLRSMVSVGWVGTGLVSMHYYLSYRALRFYQPPEFGAGDAHRDSDAPWEVREPVEFPGGLGPRHRCAQQILALHTAVIFGVAYYGFLNNMLVLLVGFVGIGVYNGLILLHQFMSSRNVQILTLGHAGLSYHGQNLSWAEIGRAWAGTDRHRHLVAIETSEGAAKRMLQATTWVNRLFDKAEVARGKAGTAVHSVVIDMRYLLGEAAELVRAIEAHRPPGSRWMPTAEVS